jgi:hypothetical protein
MAIGKFNDEQLIEQIRYDAFHGATIAASLDSNHPLRETLKANFERVLEVLDQLQAAEQQEAS